MASEQYVWFDGKFVKSKDAKVHILTHSLQYGSGVFEGIRVYDTKDGSAVFRLKDHLKRLLNSAKIYNMKLDYNMEELHKAITDLVKKNGLKSCYIRPIAFYNDTSIGLGVKGKKVSIAIAAVPFGNYFKDKDKGIRCKVSSWYRIDSGILPTQAKASGNYINSIIASMEAKNSGADEAIMLFSNGYVAEGPGENIFLVKDSMLVTPSKESDILVGITRDSVIKIAEDIGVQVEERFVHREELYTADELFFTGTAAEITPILSVDNREIGFGKIGPITKVISDAFSKAVNGEKKEFNGWLTPVK